MLHGKTIWVTIFFAVITLAAKGNIQLPLIFQSNMVLQRDKPVAIWGFGSAGEKVAIHFNGASYVAVTSGEGNWSVRLPAQSAGGPYNLIIKGDSNSIELKNILFGDVWVCGGQSNMQISIEQVSYSIKDTIAAMDPELRLFTASVGMDYVPRKDLAGGSWKEASLASIKSFSATAYFFGKFLRDSLKVPVGLVSDNLGATYIESWMSAEALARFPQFSGFCKAYLQPGKSFQEVTAAFESGRKEWENEYYLKGEGLKEKWYLPSTDVSDWKTMEIPGWWEDKGLPGFDGAVWFRRSFDLPKEFSGGSFSLALSQIDDYDIVWVNGTKVGESFGNVNWRNYSVAADILKPQGNVLVVRVFDAGGKGGMYSHPMWGNPILLGSWLYRPDQKIDAAAFPKPHVVNASPFSTPAVLYNGNVAPISDLSIKGIIWYQGESNASRAAEYRQLFPAFISDWRAQFKQGDLPLIFVQLANYMQEASLPGESDWAELRDAQAAALKLPNTAMAVTIDIGEANDIHPKNKWDVGKRLGMAALNIAYGRDIIFKGPSFKSMEIIGNVVVIHYEKDTGPLVTGNKYGYVSGFAVAGEDHQFHWAKAFTRDNTVVVSSDQVDRPVDVRYGWSDNPGIIDLYNTSGLPAVPFRTDRLPFRTEGKVFSENPWE